MRVGVHGGDDPVASDPSCDARGACVLIHALHILARHEGKQAKGLRLGLGEGARLELLRCSQVGLRIGDEGAHRAHHSLVVSVVDGRLGAGIVDLGCKGNLAQCRNQPAHPPDLGDELGHGVLGRHRISEHRGVHDALSLASEHAGGTHHLGHELAKEPWGLRGGDAPSPGGEHRGVQAGILEVEAKRQLPAQVGGTCAVASVSKRPSKTWSTMCVSTREAGMEGRPVVEGYRWRERSSGKSSRRCAARKA